MATKASDEKTITIRTIRPVRTQITIVGDTPLIVHAWSDKAKRQMLEAQQKTVKTKKAREPKNPFQDFVTSLYWLEGAPADFSTLTEKEFSKLVTSGKAKFGFPVTAIKMAAVNAAFRAKDIPNLVCMKGAFFLRGEEINDEPNMEYATIEGVPESREDMVHIGSGPSRTTDIRYRAMFRDWKMKLTIEHNDNGTISLEQIVNAINLGGYMCGIGEWRPERDGQFGMFHVEV